MRLYFTKAIRQYVSELEEFFTRRLSTFAGPRAGEN
jgi:hypothetical protein